MGKPKTASKKQVLDLTTLDQITAAGTDTPRDLFLTNIQNQIESLQDIAENTDSPHQKLHILLRIQNLGELIEVL